MRNANEYCPLYFLDVVRQHLVDNCPGFRLEEQDADVDKNEAIFCLRHDASGLLTDLRCPESPSFYDAQEWCLGFLSLPLHELMETASRRFRELDEEKGK